MYDRKHVWLQYTIIQLSQIQYTITIYNYPKIQKYSKISQNTKILYFGIIFMEMDINTQFNRAIEFYFRLSVEVMRCFQLNRTQSTETSRYGYFKTLHYSHVYDRKQFKVVLHHKC